LDAVVKEQDANAGPVRSEDDPKTAPRRYVRKHGTALVRRVAEYAEIGDEAGYRQMLYELEIYEGTPQFDVAMEGFYQFCRERQR